jgi:hypothetical protein
MNYPMKTKQNSKTNKLLSISQLTIQVVTQILNTFLTEQTFMVVGLVWRMKEAVDPDRPHADYLDARQRCSKPSAVRKAKEYT